MATIKGNTNGTVPTSLIDDILNGTSSSDTFYGYAGNDTLNSNSSGGNDTMYGGLGNDTYIVNSTGDAVKETTAQGTDTVNSTITYTLPVNVENLTLLGTAAINATGNTLANTLTGNSGNNILSGGTGADTMMGGDGNDTYLVDSVGDVITENAGGGTDTVNSAITYALPTGRLENLTLTGSAAINGTGNDSVNTLIGNTGNNTLSGAGGFDVMKGGTGNDTLNGDAGNDTLYGEAGNDVLKGGAGNDILNGGAGNNTLNGGAGQDFYDISTGGSDTIVIPKGDSAVSLFSIGNDTVKGFTSNDKLDLDSAGVMANATVNTANDSAHFKNFTISNGILTLKNGNTAVALDGNSTQMLEIFTYISQNSANFPKDDAVAIKISSAQPHTLILESHTGGGITLVDILGSLTSLSSSQII